MHYKLEVVDITINVFVKKKKKIMSEIEHNYECHIVKQTSPVLMMFFNSSMNIWYLLCKVYTCSVNVF